MGFSVALCTDETLPIVERGVRVGHFGQRAKRIWEDLAECFESLSASSEKPDILIRLDGVGHADTGKNLACLFEWDIL